MNKWMNIEKTALNKMEGTSAWNWLPFYFCIICSVPIFFSCIIIIIIFFFFFWLCWVFVSVRGLSPVAASRGHSSSRCAGLSLSRPLLLRSTGSRRAGSVVVAHWPSRSAACGILPDQGSNPCPLHWQADSQPLCHQGGPQCLLLQAALTKLMVSDQYMSIVMQYG